MKLFSYYTNDGDWGGMKMRYIKADSKEMAVASKEYLKYKQNSNYDVGDPKEVKLTDLLKEIIPGLTNFNAGIDKNGTILLEPKVKSIKE